MRNRIKRIMVVVMTLLMIVTGIVGTDDSVQAVSTVVKNMGDSQFTVRPGVNRASQNENNCLGCIYLISRDQYDSRQRSTIYLL